MHPYRQILLIVLIGLLGLAILSSLFLVNLNIAKRNIGGESFLPVWIAARYWLIEGVSPYDDKVSLAIQIARYGHPADPANEEMKISFRDPLPLMLFIGPIGLLDYPIARALWMTFLELCLWIMTITGLKVANWAKPQLGYIFTFMLFTVLSYPGFAAIVEGQTSVISAILIILTIFLIRKKMDILAGILLSLSLVKPALASLFLVYTLFWAISNRRKDILWGSVGGGAIIIAISLLFINNWPLQLIRLSFANPSPYTSLITIITNVAPGIKSKLNLLLYIFTGGVLLFEWARSMRSEERGYLWTAYLTIVLTFFLFPIARFSESTILIPILFLIIRVVEERWGGVGKVLNWIIIAILGFGIWIIRLRAPAIADGMILIVPLYELVALWWMRWWVLNPPRVFTDELENAIG